MQYMTTTEINTFQGSWSKVIAKWGNMNREYLTKTGDFPAWYVENSNSALFSAAAWQCGYLALCEVDIEKQRYTGLPGRPKTTGGRFDIELHMGEGAYVIEAKKRHFSLSESSSYSLRHHYLKSSVEDASGDCRSCKKSAAEYEMNLAALIFFSCSVGYDAPERNLGKGYREAIFDLMTQEASAFENNMRELRLVPKSRLLGYSLFSNDPLSFDRKDWKGYPWPAMCGVIGILFS